MAVLSCKYLVISTMLAATSIFFNLFILYGEVSCNEVHTRIVNGLVAKRGNFPYQISLQVNGNLHCGGTILDKYHILTAAHCIEGFNPGVISVVVGSADFRTAAGARHQIASVNVHQNYQAGNGWPNDIALLRLAQPLAFNKYVAPAVLPQRGEDWNAGQSAVVSGFGQTSHNSPSSPVLYKTQVFITTTVDCQRAYGRDTIRATNICTRHPNKVTGFCRGDSGGPLTVNGKVVEVVSFSLEDGCAGQSMAPQVYTRISEYIDWINYWRNA